MIDPFGNEDAVPLADQLNRTQAVLQELGKGCEFYRHDGLGRVFFDYERSGFKPESMLEGWKKIFSFLDKQPLAAR